MISDIASLQLKKTEDAFAFANMYPNMQVFVFDNTEKRTFRFVFEFKNIRQEWDLETVREEAHDVFKERLLNGFSAFVNLCSAQKDILFAQEELQMAIVAAEDALLSSPSLQYSVIGVGNRFEKNGISFWNGNNNDFTINDFANMFEFEQSNNDSYFEVEKFHKVIRIDTNYYLVYAMNGDTPMIEVSQVRSDAWNKYVNQD